MAIDKDLKEAHGVSTHVAKECDFRSSFIEKIYFDQLLTLFSRLIVNKGLCVSNSAELTCNPALYHVSHAKENERIFSNYNSLVY